MDDSGVYREVYRDDDAGFAVLQQDAKIIICDLETQREWNIRHPSHFAAVMSSVAASSQELRDDKAWQPFMVRGDTS